jgi:hypothetical protein
MSSLGTMKSIKKNKELKKVEGQWEEANLEWNALAQLNIPYFNMEKLLLAKIMNITYFKFWACT